DTRPLQREKALRMANAPLPGAGWAGLGTCPWFCARARAGFAGNRGWNSDLRGLAGIGLFQPDLHVVAQVGAALPARAGPPSAAHAENAFEQIGEGRAKITAKAAEAPSSLLEGSVAEPIVGGALVRVFENFVGLVDLLESCLGVAVPRITVRVPFHCELAECRFQHALVDGPLDP